MRVTGATPLILVLAAFSPAFAQPVLRSADVRVVLVSPTACSVTSRFSVDGMPAGGLEHRLHAPDGFRVDQLEVGGDPIESSTVQRRGATLSYTVKSAAGSTYEVAYHVAGSDAWTYRCPLWLPVAPTDGISRALRVRIELPPGAAPAGTTMPAFEWAGARGEATLGHLPAFVRVPYASADHMPAGVERLDLSRIVDGIAIVVLVAATILWFARARKGARAKMRETSPS